MGKKEQAAQEWVILVDDQDRFVGRYAPRHEAHRDPGLHHRAFVCLILDSHHRVLLQRRKHWLWDGRWDLTVASHPLHLGDRDETYEEAAARALRREMGIEGVAVHRVGGFNYYARHPVGDGCENEYCAILVGFYEGPVHPNVEDVYTVQWIAWDALVQDIQRHPDAYTPWAQLAVNTLQRTGQTPGSPGFPASR